MSKNNDGPSLLRRLFSSQSESSDKKPSKLLYMGAILAAGIIFMLVSNLQSTLSTAPGNKSEEVVPAGNDVPEDEPVFGQKKSGSANTMTNYEEHYENQLKETLESIIGVDDVEVIVNVDATESKVYEKNTVTQSQTTDEEDRDGGTRKVEDTSKDEQLVIVRSGDQEKPVVVKTEKPKIRGVLVVAKGVDNIEVKKWVIEAVTRALDVPSHRVAVLPKKSKGD